MFKEICMNTLRVVESFALGASMVGGPGSMGGEIKPREHNISFATYVGEPAEGANINTLQNNEIEVVACIKAGADKSLICKEGDMPIYNYPVTTFVKKDIFDRDVTDTDTTGKDGHVSLTPGDVVGNVSIVDLRMPSAEIASFANVGTKTVINEKGEKTIYITFTPVD